MIQRLLVYVILIALCICNATAAQDTCIMTTTECQCAQTTPSGMCTRNQGDGTCLLGKCSAGFRCDCFGFEVCAINKCSKHIPIGTEDPSETVPFRCESRAGNADCIVLKDVIETATAAVNAEADATASNDESTEIELEAANDLETVQNQKKAVMQMLKDVERVADDMPDEELDAIDADVEQVEDAIEETTELVVGAVKEAKKACKGLREVRRLKREARRKYEKCGKLKKELEDENKKPARDLPKVLRLKKTIRELEDGEKKASGKCGRKTQEIRSCRKRANDKLKECKRVKKRCDDVVRGCSGKVKMSIGRVRGHMRA